MIGSTYRRNIASFGAALANAGPLDLSNSSLSNHQSAHYALDSTGGMTLTNVTLAHNSASAARFNSAANATHLFNTLLADSDLFNCDTSDPVPAQHSSSDDDAGNFSGSGNHIRVNMFVSPLGYHFGPSLTDMIAADSPAVGAVARQPMTRSIGCL